MGPQGPACCAHAGATAESTRRSCADDANLSPATAKCRADRHRENEQTDLIRPSCADARQCLAPKTTKAHCSSPPAAPASTQTCPWQKTRPSDRRHTHSCTSTPVAMHEASLLPGPDSQGPRYRDWRIDDDDPVDPVAPAAGTRQSSLE